MRPAEGDVEVDKAGVTVGVAVASFLFAWPILFKATLASSARPSHSIIKDGVSDEDERVWS